MGTLKFDERIRKLLLKNFTMFLSFMLALLLVLGGLVFAVSYWLTDKEFKTFSQKSLYNFQTQMENIFEQTNSVASRLITTDDVQLFFMSDNSVLAYNRDNLKSQLLNYRLTNAYIDSVYLYNVRGDTVYSLEELSKSNQFSDMAWLDTFNQMSANEKYKFIARKKNNSYPEFITFIKPVNLNGVGVDNQGAIVINLDVKILSDYLKFDDETSKQEFYVLDQQGNIFYAKNSSLVGAPFFKTDNTLIVNSKDSTLLQANSARFPELKFVALIPKQFYNNRFAQLLFIIVLVLVLCFAIGFYYAYVVARRVTVPVHELVNALEHPREFRENNMRINTVEIREILKNHLAKKSEGMDIEVEERLKLLGDTQALVMQSQINPHFLHNTLENIKWLSLELSDMQENAVSDMVAKLSESMNYVQGGDLLVPASDELNYTKLYVDLMYARYGDKFTLNWEINENIYHCKLLKIMLQPLIENAIYHGIKQVKHKGEITVSIAVNGENVEISVNDNGKGMSREKLSELSRILKKPYYVEKNHIGLANVNGRLKILFGDKYTIEIKSEYNYGTAITLTIPKILV